MSSARYAAPLRLEPRRSRRLAIGLAAAHGGALVLLPLLPLGAFVAAALGGLIILSWSWNHVLHVARRADRSLVSLVWLADGEWRLTERGGATRTGRLRWDSYVHPWLTVLNFTGARRCSVVLLPDSLDPETFRRLRVRLGLQGMAATESVRPV
jgi:hypothetical protein